MWCERKKNDLKIVVIIHDHSVYCLNWVARTQLSIFYTHIHTKQTHIIAFVKWHKKKFKKKNSKNNLPHAIIPNGMERNYDDRKNKRNTDRNNENSRNLNFMLVKWLILYKSDLHNLLLTFLDIGHNQFGMDLKRFCWYEWYVKLVFRRFYFIILNPNQFHCYFVCVYIWSY